MTAVVHPANVGRNRSYDTRDLIDGAIAGASCALAVGATMARAWWVPLAVVAALVGLTYAAVGLLRAGGPIRTWVRPGAPSPADWWNGAGCLLGIAGIATMGAVPYLPAQHAVQLFLAAIAAVALGFALVIVP